VPTTKNAPPEESSDPGARTKVHDDEKRLSHEGSNSDARTTKRTHTKPQFLLPMSREEFPFDNTQIPETPQLYIRRDEDRMMQGKTWRRLGIALWILGFIILVANGVAVIGHYLVG